MEIAFPDLREALDNTLDVAEMVDIKIPLGENHYPKYEAPKDLVYNKDELHFNRILDLYVKKRMKFRRKRANLPIFTFRKTSALR